MILLFMTFLLVLRAYNYTFSTFSFTDRSFPSNKKFLVGTAEGKEGRASLFRILATYARYNPKVGYCQGAELRCCLLFLFLALRCLNFLAWNTFDNVWYGKKDLKINGILQIAHVHLYKRNTLSEVANVTSTESITSSVVLRGEITSSAAFA